MKVWFVDDREENRTTWLASFPAALRAAGALRTFAAVPDLLAALEAGERPDVVFLDFFVDGHYGWEVLERYAVGDLPVPLLVAHSSMPEANAGLVRAGAHLAMEKVKGAAITRSIAEAIRDVGDLRRLIRVHRHASAGPGPPHT